MRGPSHALPILMANRVGNIAQLCGPEMLELGELLLQVAARHGGPVGFFVVSSL